MTKLLIVDDDRFIREGLKKLIDWDELGIEIVGEAEGGIEALRLFEEHSPHIILTDIRMPQGSGLELIEQVRSRGWNTQFIVLSGYNDYAYVRQAMKFQVEDYLLKPVDPHELKEIMKTCCERTRNQWLHEQLQRESFQLLRNNILLRWVSNRIEADQLRQKLRFLELDLQQADFYQAGLISWHDLKDGELSQAEEQFRSFAILNSMQEALQAEHKGIAFFNEQKQIVLLLHGSSDADNASAYAQVNLLWMREISERFAGILKTPWFCTLGSVQPQADWLHLSYSEAKRLHKCIERTGGPLCVDDSTLGRAADANKMGRAINQGNQTEKQTEEQIGEQSEEQIGEQATKRKNRLIVQVESYLEEHYAKELSLKLLAARFSVNNFYLGRLFKEETDEYFSDYLNRLRMDKAKALLRQTSLKGFEIAAQVGFLDHNYFFRKFKQMTGLSPTEYRNGEDLDG
ncbi:response regulator transcription factor [Paenibacillus eucommiae]|uniref:YesN/AraC family two-component response regulator n=1 Tax=Paenibacillus eucommiae TaxID=1355755 RepID=A0ABS4INQ5_9BACL|nr:response regulator transcription factor [Paenibacillus eucommiae]MBP1988666.1 YesN/AraC family two-component response regulator [Paenibacillus eucommiae]